MTVIERYECSIHGPTLARLTDGSWCIKCHAFVKPIKVEYIRADAYTGAVEALRYLVERCEREFRDQDQPPELDFVMLAVNEVREKRNV